VCLRTHVNAFNQFAWTPDRVQAFASGLDYLVDEHDLDVVFVPFQALDPTQHDNRIHEAVATAMRRRSRTTILQWSDDVPAVSRIFGGAACVIAMRLHAAVLARALSRRSVLMPYDHKVVEFGRLMGVRDQITADTLDHPSGMRRVLDAAMSGDRQAAHAFADPWETLTLAGPANRAVVA
jgi:polysaccharide pyruvyl transferase WcaK-like protein